MRYEDRPPNKIGQMTKPKACREWTGCSLGPSVTTGAEGEEEEEEEMRIGDILKRKRRWMELWGRDWGLDCFLLGNFYTEPVKGGVAAHGNNRRKSKILG